MNTNKLYEEYKTKMQKIADVKYASAVLQWDQETYLPPKGNDKRGQQIATLNEIAHELFTTEKLGGLLNELNNTGDLSEDEKRNVELSLDDYNRNIKIPSAFVKKMSEAINKSFHAWIQARKENSFSVFQQPLHDIIELKKQEAEMLGYEAHPYNALMNDYDKGLTVAITDKLFASLQPQLLALLDKIKNAPQVDNAFLHNNYPKEKQWDFGIDILKEMNFDLNAGRQDISEHPFTTNFSSEDVRLTTRVDENDMSNMLWSCIHEGGHGLYEQSLPIAQYGLPLGEYCSLSIHESQSRIWENNVGRGASFWEYNFPKLKTIFPQQLKGKETSHFYKAINKVQPALIRTEADELTYHFHVMIRYEIEKMLIDNTIQAKDIPAYWNEHYQKYLDVTVPDDKHGCLQDIHWSHGSFGYFATYSLGSLYAAQLYAAAGTQIVTLESEIGNGNNKPFLDWLKLNIHRFGRKYTSEQLCKNATGSFLDSKYFMEYADKKYSDIYDL